MILAINFCIIGMIFFIIRFFSIEDFLKLSPELKEEIKKASLQREGLIREPLLITRPLLPLNRIILSRLGRKKMLDLLSLAEIRLSAEDYLGIKELITAAIVIIMYAVTRRFEPLWFFIGFFIGFVFPDIFVKKKIAKRRAEIVKQLPDAVDLLNLCVGSGLDFMLGMHWVVERSKPSALMREFAIINHNIRMGKARQQALRDMAKRLRIQEVNSFTNALIHADRMGTPITEVLSNLSEEARRQRFQRGRRQALKAPIKMLFPLVFCILPVVGIIIGGPIILQFLQGGLPGFK